MKRYLLLIIYTCVCAIGPTWAEDRIDGLSMEPTKAASVYSPAASAKPYKPTISQAGMAVQPTAARFGAPIARGRGDGGAPIIDFPDDPTDEFLDYPEPLSDSLWILLLMAIMYGIFVRYFRYKDVSGALILPLFKGKKTGKMRNFLFNLPEATHILKTTVSKNHKFMTFCYLYLLMSQF